MRNSAAIASLLLIAVLLVLSDLFPDLVVSLSVEDGIVENATALLFLVASLLFLWRLRIERKTAAEKGFYASLWLGVWAVLMFLFAAEEISWGQRIFDFSTPDSLEAINRQNEFNFHNIEAVHSTFGGTHRFLSLIMLGMGVALPIANRIGPLNALIRRVAIPVPSVSCAILFTGAYLYGIYFVLFPQEAAPDRQFEILYSAIEVRELLLALATFCFAGQCLRGALPDRPIANVAATSPKVRRTGQEP